VLVGFQRASKGQQDAIAAVEILTTTGVDVELELIGDSLGDFGDQLRELATRLGVADRVHFVDFHQGHLERVANADAALMCSRSEAFGRVTIEAMKLGKPVVGAAAGATPDLVRHGWNGFLYEAGDPADLAGWITRLAHDRDSAREMGRRGQQWACEAFNRGIYGAELEHALQTVADGGGRGEVDA
jgi:glycosyltransferase involved in cell wall biosynthesis